MGRTAPAVHLYAGPINREQKWYLPYESSIMHSYNNWPIGPASLAAPRHPSQSPSDTPLPQ